MVAAARASRSGQTGVPMESARLILEPLGPQHHPLLLELDGDEEVMRFLTGGRASTPAEVEEQIAQAIGHRWVLWVRGGSFVGWAGLHPSGPGEHELGYRIMRPCWGQGLATEASLRLIDLAFGDWGDKRVWAQTMVVNQRSRAVLERCRLRYVRTFHLEWEAPIAGSEQGEVEYELLYGEWERRRSAQALAEMGRPV
jgi:RimJ/RimL family protein N-acetyltransferase